MASRKARIEARDKKVFSKYSILKKKNINGVSLLTFQSILETLSIEFYLAPETIEKIITKHKKSNK